MLRLITSNTCLTEKKYIFNQILIEFLGIEYELLIQNSISGIKIAKGGREILLNSYFFDQFENKAWLSLLSMPNAPLQTLSNIDSIGSPFLQFEDLPILYGENKVIVSDNNIEIGIDVFGSCFFMLSRYEELIINKRDKHDRFPASESIAFKEGFLKRPIVDEYVEVLWQSINLLWPEVQRKQRTQNFFVSCDVDHLIDKGIRIPFVFKRVASDLIIKKSIKKTLRSIKSFFQVCVLRQTSKDPYNMFDYMMAECEKRGLKMAFYFIPLGNNDKREALDSQYDIEGNEVNELINQIVRRGHEVGYHASYGTYLDERKTSKEVELLKKVYTKSGGDPDDVIGGRQHYLRWKTGITERNWELSGLKYDCTLGYAQEIGFRCGTSNEYYFYDLNNRKTLNLKIRPLIVMDVTILSEEYMSLGHSKALEKVKEIKNVIDRYKGDFTLLWHNSSFSSKKDRSLFEGIIALNQTN